MTDLLFGAALIFVGGIAAMFVPEKAKAWAFVLFAAVAQFVILPAALKVLLNGQQLALPLFLSEPIGEAYLRLDPLAALFVIVTSAGSFLTPIYSIGYMKMYHDRGMSLSSHFFFLGVMSASMLLVEVTQNAILFIIVWEMMSTSSFFLVAFENENEEVRRASFYYFIAMQVGVAFLIAAFAWTSALSGSLDFNSFSSVLDGHGSVAILLFVLFFIGFGTKAGFVPMHTWLPKAHPASPTGVSALMSGVMIKTGIYGILRILLLTGIPDYRLAYGVFFVSLITGIYGIVNSIAQDDIKRLLAYSSIENIGIIGMGIGVGMLGLAYNSPLIAMLGFFGALLHIVNHFTFKSVLFYGSGVVYSQTHKRDMNLLGGLGKYLPVTSAMFLAGSLAISGVPFFNGFVSEIAIYLGMARGLSLDSISVVVVMLLGFAGLAFIGAMALLSFTKVYGITFLGLPRTEYHATPTEKERTLLLPMVVLTIAMLAIGFFPWLAVELLMNVVRELVPGLPAAQFTPVLGIFRTISAIVIGLAAVTAFFFGLRNFLLRKRTVGSYKTWDCGYQVGSGRLEYTGSSFAQPFLHLVAELVPREISVDKEPVFFPMEASLESRTQDLSERYILKPLIALLNKFLNLFSWIQSGRMQQYIMYGLVFLVFLLVWILGIR